MQTEKNSIELMKKIIIGIIAIIIGTAIALFAYSFFREQIQNIFLWSTSNRIKFFGKDIYFFSNYFYYLSFGIAFLIFTITNFKQNFKQIISNGLLSIIIFGIVLIGISWVDANLKILECTACENGIRNLNWNEIEYGLILGFSIIISIIPNFIRAIKNRKKPA